MAATVQFIPAPPGLCLAEHVNNACQAQSYSFLDECKKQSRLLKSQLAHANGRLTVHMSGAKAGEPVYLYLLDSNSPRNGDSLASNASTASTAVTEGLMPPYDHSDASLTGSGSISCAVSPERKGFTERPLPCLSTQLCNPKGNQTTVLLAYFPRSATEDDLLSVLTKITGANSIDYLTIMREPSGASKCFGFAKFDTADHAQTAIRACAGGEVVLDDEDDKRWHLKASLAKKEAMIRKDNPHTRQFKSSQKHCKQAFWHRPCRSSTERN